MIRLLLYNVRYLFEEYENSLYTPRLCTSFSYLFIFFFPFVLSFFSSLLSLLSRNRVWILLVIPELELFSSPSSRHQFFSFFFFVSFPFFWLVTETRKGNGASAWCLIRLANKLDQLFSVSYRKQLTFYSAVFRKQPPNNSKKERKEDQITGLLSCTTVAGEYTGPLDSMQQLARSGVLFAVSHNLFAITSSLKSQNRNRWSLLFAIYRTQTAIRRDC